MPRRWVGLAAVLVLGALSACEELPLPPLPESERDEAAVYAAALREGEALAFAWLDVPLQLALVELDTSLLGTDAARFVLETGGTSVEQAHARVDALLLDLAEQEGVTFVRNGSDHSAEEAAAHLRRKFDHARDEIRSVDDFIRLCGTQNTTHHKR